MQGFRGENLTTIQKGTIRAFEVGQGHQTDWVDRLLECAQARGI